MANRTGAYRFLGVFVPLIGSKRDDSMKSNVFMFLYRDIDLCCFCEGCLSPGFLVAVVIHRESRDFGKNTELLVNES